MPHESLFRRFRPQRFRELIGQDHLVRAMQGAIRTDRVGQAYLLCGPRGTGKTTTARILAKALNCENLTEDGEPCCGCHSCMVITAGKSLDLIELDAASNNSVEQVRHLVDNAALVSAGRRKVYLLDEVHMLTNAASNALLKTLEEPPPHVVFILATTDPERLLPTIRSRTQRFDLALVAPGLMEQHIRSVADAAGIAVDNRIVAHVVREGRGSVRDTLSALDTVVVTESVPADPTGSGNLVDAIMAGEASGVLDVIADAINAGVDARTLAGRAFQIARDRVREAARAAAAAGNSESAFTTHRLVCIIRSLGDVLGKMPRSADRRLDLEAALLALIGGSEYRTDDITGPEQEPAAKKPAEDQASATEEKRAVGDNSDRSAPPGRAEPATAESLGLAWSDAIISRLRPVAKGVFREAKVLEFDGSQVRISLPANVPETQVQRRSGELEEALSAYLQQAVAAVVEN